MSFLISYLLLLIFYVGESIDYILAIFKSHIFDICQDSHIWAAISRTEQHLIVFYDEFRHHSSLFHSYRYRHTRQYTLCCHRPSQAWA